MSEQDSPPPEYPGSVGGEGGSSSPASASQSSQGSNQFRNFGLVFEPAIRDVFVACLPRRAQVGNVSVELGNPSEWEQQSEEEEQKALQAIAEWRKKLDKEFARQQQQQKRSPLKPASPAKPSFLSSSSSASPAVPTATPPATSEAPQRRLPDVDLYFRATWKDLFVGLQSSTKDFHRRILLPRAEEFQKLKREKDPHSFFVQIVVSASENESIERVQLALDTVQIYRDYPQWFRFQNSKPGEVIAYRKMKIGLIFNGLDFQEFSRGGRYAEFSAKFDFVCWMQAKNTVEMYHDRHQKLQESVESLEQQIKRLQKELDELKNKPSVQGKDKS